MITNHTNRATVRPSRLRITRARVGAWFDRHDDAVTLAVVATVVALVSAILAVALVQDYAVSIRDSIAIATIVIALSGISGAFSYLVGSERASRRVSRRYSRYLSDAQEETRRANDRHRKVVERITRARDEARREASRNAYALLTALEETDTH